MTTTTTKRTYGTEHTFGDIIYNPSTKSVFCSMNWGFFGKTTVTLIKRIEDGCYDLMKSYKDRNGQEQIICVGKTFPVKKKDGSIVEGLTQGTLGLLKRYDAEIKKEVTGSSDALFITTHKLKETKSLSDSGFIKVGYISGKFGIESIASSNGNTAEDYAPESQTYDDDNEVIPF